TVVLESLLLAMLILYFAVVIVPSGRYVRYLLPLLPVACLLGSAWTWRYVKWQTLAIMLIGVQSVSNCLSVVTAYPIGQSHTLRFPILEYTAALREPYTDSFTDVLQFFRKEANPGELILAPNPEFPLMFYTELGIIDFGVAARPPRMPEWILA